ncbi:MAG: hypothetical protein ABIQ90_02845, partial [Polaromonas sp.]
MKLDTSSQMPGSSKRTTSIRKPGSPADAIQHGLGKARQPLALVQKSLRALGIALAALTLAATAHAAKGPGSSG